MDLLAFILALQADGKTAEEVRAAVDQYLEDNPGAIDQAAVEAILDGRLDDIEEDVGGLKSAVADLEAGSLSALDASSGQVPTADGEGSWEWATPSGGGDVTDVQVNGESVVADGVANVRVADDTTPGVVCVSSSYGIKIRQSSQATPYALSIDSADVNQIKGGANNVKPIVPNSQHASTFYGLAKAAGADMASSSNPVGTYTDAAKSAISTMLNAPETVSGTTPSITAKAGIQYICGEVATLDITLPASGCIDVVFQSGSTPTVLTVTPPTGVTVKWANGFDPTSLEANTAYEINIKDGLGVAASWT